MREGLTMDALGASYPLRARDRIKTVVRRSRAPGEELAQRAESVSLRYYEIYGSDT